MKAIALGIFAISFSAASAGCEMFQSHGDPKLAAEAKITSDAARAIALKAQPGTVKEWELEKEAGGSGLRYSFDILNSGVIHEVGVDAADGKVLENAVETDEDEAREAKEEGKVEN
jgi:uncharacterized membrane protein YkoI